MKFCKSYEKYMKQLGKTLPGIGYRRLKKNINQCRNHMKSQDEAVSPLDCSVCDGIFFPSLFDEMSAVVDCFDKEARKLLDPPLSCPWGIWRYSCFDCSGNGRKDHVLMKEGQELLIYAMVNAIAFRKILKKYDKVHKSEKGREFKSGSQVKHIMILQSPWFHELMSFLINLRDRKFKDTSPDASLFEDLALMFNNEIPSMSCGLFDSFWVDVNLICPICLDIVFDAVALRCGHILCYMCACSAASVTIVDGLKAATPKQKCPLCREARVYGNAIRLDELNILLSKRCPEYWEKRLESERVERLRLVKEHWQSQVNGLS
ncbi:probable E3 ubiquitin-protein ligase BAH1-like 1 [Chenopodium quinoa]|uniref:RING-type E3 ubiquitin transferase n=1 Tax=Chenopodium quinoa TaxID=63459 RepID=A0A803L6U7_CHEQI|nr:probable E3 ubiquitin-protein ligase BAH1-like 1 [Chenopodium quinoa]